MIVHMCKLQIVTLDEQFDRLIEGLQRLGYLHLEPVPLADGQAAGRLHRMQLTAEDERRRMLLSEARRTLEELRTVLDGFPPPDAGEREHGAAPSPQEIAAAAAEMLRRVRSIRRRRRNLEQDRRILARYMRVGHLIPRVGVAEDEAEVAMFTFPSEERLVWKSLHERLRAMEIASLELRKFRLAGGQSVAAVVAPAERMEEIREAAWRAGTLEFKLPAAYRTERLLDSFRRVEADLESMPARLAELDAELEHFRQQAGHYAAALDLHCAEESQRLEVKDHFVEGSLLRVLHAYLPIDKKDEVLRLAAELTGDRIEVAELELGQRLEDVPVVLKNPAFARPFEILLRIFPPPTYGTFDPTVVNAVGVPFFFGLIVGDIAYGAIILGLALWLRWRYRRDDTLRSIAAIGIYCASSAIAFGFLYGELFGSLGTWLGLKAVIHREDPEELLLLLKIAICLGAIHVGLGLLLGMINARQILDRHAFNERLGQFLCLVSVVLFVVEVAVGGWIWIVAATACLAAGIVVLLAGAGVVGLLEVFSLFSNILSYSRLMALGVASVVLALVANRIFAELNSGLVGLMAAAVLHALNIAIAMFSPTIHTLRLHYVEFFTKFYRPEGRSYSPFGVRPSTLE